MKFVLVFLIFASFAQAKTRDSWPTLDWTTNSTLSAESAKKIEASIFLENSRYQTDSFLIVKNGKLVFEKYARGYGKSMPHLAWSMSKTFASSMLALAIDHGYLKVDDLVSKYLKYDIRDSKSQERFKKLTIKHLLEMSSGFDWDETYGNPTTSDVVAMLYFPIGYKNMGEFTLSRPMTSDPGVKFLYSTGETNLIMEVVKKAIPQNEYDEFPFKHLFSKIGMNSAVWERDQSGTFIGGSYVYATPRDFLKFGFMLLNEGQWNGQKILSKEWVDYTKTTSNEKMELSIHDNQPYGAHLWTNTKNSYYPNKPYPDAPENMFIPIGHQGQWMFILPDQDMIVLRMGEDDHPRGVETMKLRNHVLKTVLEVFK